MFVLRATVKLRKHWKLPPPQEGVSLGNSCSLGDLYANAVSIGRRRIILGVFERTFLPVILPLAQLTPTLAALRAAVAERLRVWNVSPSVIERSLPDTNNTLVTSTASRVALGVLNDFGRLLQYDDPDKSDGAEALFLSDTPVGPIGMDSPKRATLILLASASPPFTCPSI
jgi:hypothetical protein